MVELLLTLSPGEDRDQARTMVLINDHDKNGVNHARNMVLINDHDKNGVDHGQNDK